ncbi:7534_t:CDS:2 [Funneliformis mosseae]|uniref:7534_t:CDS:1 n=1 Tax=Funneliformis mosseae TaxID=27381 RepID=A0A9N9CBB1_FUNMO|nr:7534_t:CDS:2 [Funneliformis mosseae]
MDEYLTVENGIRDGVITQYMPIEILDKVSPEEVPDIQSIVPNAKIGYILEVDLEIPVHLHDFFANYPLMPKSRYLCSYNHQIYLERVNKIRLNSYDNKRWILLDGIQTLPYEYWRIGLYKYLVAFGISSEKAEERAMKVRLQVKE